MATIAKKKPYRQYRTGDLTLTIFENTLEGSNGRKFTTYGASIRKRYIDKNGEVKFTSYISHKDMLAAGQLLLVAWKRLLINEDK